MHLINICPDSLHMHINQDCRRKLHRRRKNEPYICMYKKTTFYTFYLHIFLTPSKLFEIFSFC
jgi:hypothetical protein